jgi:hypothetical protein
MRKIILFFLLLLTTFLYSQDTISKNDISSALTILNKARKDAGLDTVSISQTLSEGCFKHAKYLVLNKNNPLTSGLAAHKEYPALPGFSKKGEIAGKSSVIHFVKPSEAIGGWLQTFYHRIPLLQPNLKEIGIGFYEKNGYTVSLIDCISGTNGQNTIPVVCYPNMNQNNIPLDMGPEIPHPVGQQGVYGFPITVYFTQFQTITNVTFKLTDKDNKVIECYISTPQKPATTFTQWNTICAIPKNKLTENNKYVVTVTCLENKKPFTKTFSFQTQKQ